MVKKNTMLSCAVYFEWHDCATCQSRPLDELFHCNGCHHPTYGFKKDAAVEILSDIMPYCLLQVIRAKKAVVSNASMWDTLDLLPPDVVPKSYEDKVKATPQCDSFMHLHLGFDVEVCFT